MIRRILAVVAVLAATGLAATAAPAGATWTPPCPIATHDTVSPFVHLAADGTTQTNGTHTLLTNGVRIVTPDAAAKVYGYLPLSPEVKLTDITAAGFANSNTSGWLPSYQFGLKVNGAWGGTLAWESTYQPAGLAGVGDVLHGGASVWYITKSFPALGYTAHTAKTWAEIVALLPADTTATYYGLNQGAGGIADNTVNTLKLATKTTCKVHKWGTVYAPKSPSGSTSATPSASTSATPSNAVTPGPSASATPIVTAPTTTPPAMVGASLPVTGPGVGIIAGVGLLLVVAGAAGIYFSRRRRTDFAA